MEPEHIIIWEDYTPSHLCTIIIWEDYTPSHLWTIIIWEVYVPSRLWIIIAWIQFRTIIERSRILDSVLAHYNSMGEGGPYGENYVETPEAQLQQSPCVLYKDRLGK